MPRDERTRATERDGTRAAQLSLGRVVRRKGLIPILGLVLAAIVGIVSAWLLRDDIDLPGSTETASVSTDGGVVIESAGQAAPPRDSAVTEGGALEASETGPGPGETPAVLLALEGEGLRLFNAATGTSRPLPFGTEGTLLRSTLESASGGGPVEEGFSPDCVATFIRWSDGLTTWVAGDRFVGWSLRDDASSLTTPTGVGIGSTRSELEDSYAADVFTSTVGIEFSTGGLAGILDSTRSDARITHLWAGHTCIAR